MNGILIDFLENEKEEEDKLDPIWTFPRSIWLHMYLVEEYSSACPCSPHRASGIMNRDRRYVC